MIEVYGLSIDDQTIYSRNPKVIAVEALAYMGLSMDYTEALRLYDCCYGTYWKSIEESDEKTEFIRKYYPLATAIRKIINGHQYRDFPDMHIVKKRMSEEEFYRLPEFQ